MESAWKSALGFSERLLVVDSLADALQTADENLSRLDAVKQARQEESACFGQAFSKVGHASNMTEYLTLFNKRKSELQNTPKLRSNTGLSLDASNLPSGVKETVGPYKSAVRINSGLFSTIFCAHPLPESDQKHRLLVLKVTHLSSLHPPHDPIREARLAKMANSPAVLEVLDTFELPGQFVLVNPYFPCDLAEFLNSGNINVHNGRSIMYDIFAGLAHIHSLAIIHRDIKPSNILLHPKDGRTVIADFGISWHPEDPSSEPVSQKVTDIGTTHYRAPELLFGFQAYGTEVDIWAAGCVFAEVFDEQHRALFESGDLGSELRLVSDIFQKLGTPTLDSWPQAKVCPDFGKLQFVEFESKPWDALVATQSPLVYDLLTQLVVYDTDKRIPAVKVLEHDFFRDVGRTPFLEHTA